jgi:Right handed beta helix region
MGFFSFIRNYYDSTPQPTAAPEFHRPVILLPKDGLTLTHEAHIEQLAQHIRNGGGDVYIDRGSKEIRSTITLSGECIPRNLNSQYPVGIILSLPGWRFANFHFHDIPGGLIVKSHGNDIVQCAFSEIGKYAIRTEVSLGLRERDQINLYVSHCNFWNKKSHDDVTILLKNGDSCTVTDSHFFGGGTGIKIGSSRDPKLWECHVRGNTFEAMPNGIHVEGKVRLIARFNKYSFVKREITKGQYVKVIK